MSCIQAINTDLEGVKTIFLGGERKLNDRWNKTYILSKEMVDITVGTSNFCAYFPTHVAFVLPLK